MVSDKLGAIQPFAELPPGFRQLQEKILRRPGGDREMVEILALVLHHDEQAVLKAVEQALAEGVPTKTHVLNILHRLIDGKTTGGPDIDTPQALILRREPKANVERYDPLPGSRQEPRSTLQAVRARQPVPGATEVDGVRTSQPDKRRTAPCGGPETVKSG